MRHFFLLLVIGASIAAFLMVIKPRYDNLKTARAEVAIANTNLETASKLKESREALIAKYQTIPKQDIDNLKKLLPDAVDNIRLIIQIDFLAKKNGLSILRNVEYQTEQSSAAVSTGSGGVMDQNLQVPVGGGKPYGDLSISFQTSGQYKNFLTFLSDLEQNLRLVDVTEVSFSNNKDDKDQVGSTVDYKVTLKTYWLKQ